jgi:DNA-nicking Smr family endonuclease
MTSKKQKEKEDAKSPFFALKELRDRMDREAKAKAEGQKSPAQKGKASPASSPSSHAAPPKKKPMNATEKAAAQEDEIVSFHRLMSGAVPLPPKNHGRAGDDALKNRRAGEVAARARAEAEEAHARLSELAFGSVKFEVSDDGARLEGRRADTPPEVLRKLRRGMYPIDARLDLHGLSAEEAETRLFTFLASARTNKERTVLVIHGKGDHSPGKIGVLRGEIGAWLSQGRARKLVSAFATADADDGGEGAIYVALAR